MEKTSTKNKQEQYFYFCSSDDEPRGNGFTDSIIVLHHQYDLILKANLAVYPVFLLDFKHSPHLNNSNPYDVNLSDLMSFKQDNIICDSNAIKDIMNTWENDMSKKIKVEDYLKYPSQFKNKIIRLDKSPTYHKYRISAFTFFYDSVILKQDLLDYIRKKNKKLPSEIAFIQIRHTDIKCYYRKYLSQNEDFLNKYDHFYVATDNINCLKRLRKIYPHKQFYNFIKLNEPKIPLHFSTSISGYVKLRDVFLDLSVAKKSVAFFSNSIGGFKPLAKFTFKKKPTCFGL
jgi:hypothetical protein